MYNDFTGQPAEKKFVVLGKGPHGDYGVMHHAETMDDAVSYIRDYRAGSPEVQFKIKNRKGETV